MIQEKAFRATSGWSMLGVLLIGLVAAIWLLLAGVRVIQEGGSGARFSVGLVALLLDVFLMFGLFLVNPTEGRVLQLFGKYVGTAREPGLRWANPLYWKRRVSLRVRNFESGRLKVNDLDGNPIEIAAGVVWKVVDTGEAMFEVDDYQNYVHVQTESALRNMATSYPYDAHDEAVLSLRGHTGAIADHLRKEIQDRLAKAGVDVIEARISHLAYAPALAAPIAR